MTTHTAESLRAVLADIRDGFANLQTPYRGQVEVATFETAPGPRSPVSAGVLDQTITTERTLAALVGEYAPAIEVIQPTDRTVEGRLTWLSRNAERLVSVMHESDLRDLEVLREQLVRLSGIHDDDTTSAVALAETRRQVLPGSSHFGTASEVARLATAAGRPVSRTTITRWALAGHVDRRGVGTEAHYSLDDVLVHHDLLAEQPAERPQYGEGYHGSSREVAELATEAGCPVSHAAVQRWAAAGLVVRTEEGYAYDHVMDVLIGDQEVGDAAE